MLVEKLRAFADKLSNPSYAAYAHTHKTLIVADAECPDCSAKYVAWIDGGSEGAHPQPRPDEPYEMVRDLSFRSTFDDEPGPSDLPLYDVTRAPIRTAKKRHSCGTPIVHDYCWKCSESVLTLPEAKDVEPSAAGVMSYFCSPHAAFTQSLFVQCAGCGAMNPWDGGRVVCACGMADTVKLPALNVNALYGKMATTLPPPSEIEVALCPVCRTSCKKGRAHLSPKGGLCSGVS